MSFPDIQLIQILFAVSVPITIIATVTTVSATAATAAATAVIV